MKKIEVNHLAQIEEANIEVADCTVFTGPQATGKSILLQLMKLVLDGGDIAKTIKRYGFDWAHDWKGFLQLYFGEGMDGIWNDATSIKVDGDEINFDAVIYKKGKPSPEKMFLIPAQRVMTLKNGWPRNFNDFESGDPYAVKRFSEHIRMLMEAGIGKGGVPIFPQPRRMKQVFRKNINDAIFNGAEVKLDTTGLRKRIILDVEENKLPFMGWSAGQREFMPLLLGLYWLLPSARTTKKEHIKVVVIEEVEMGLHPRAISSVMLIILELLQRGYKVVLSTHSQVVLDVVWTIQEIKKHQADPLLLMELFNLESSPEIKSLCKDIVKHKSFASYFFDKQGNGKIRVKNISSLDPSDEDALISGWGGLTEFSGRASDVVSEAVRSSWT